ncbi:MAG: ribonuclease H-like domain-containing protein [Chloroflexi bacterium]|nr:ribonuclease H-like domain-containing protein [Chloroflexota bacterium]
MISKERIEFVVKSNVGQLVSIERDGDMWRCHLHVPKNAEARLRSLKSTFPGLRIEQREDTEVFCTIPIYPIKATGRNLTARRSSNMRRRGPHRPERTLHPMMARAGVSRQDQLERLAEIYGIFFDSSGEVLMVDEQHFKLTLAEDLVYPFNHPFLSLLPWMMPDLTPAAILTEQLGNRKTTSIYLSTEDERPKRSSTEVSIFIDGSYRDGIGSYGVCYQMAGQPNAYLVGAMSCHNNNAAELMAFLQAIAHLAETAHNIVVYTDSTLVVDWSQGEGRAWVDQALDKHISLRVQLIDRDENNAAHTLAYKLLSRLFV